jgi:hypothetical protein
MDGPKGTAHWRCFAIWPPYSAEMTILAAATPCQQTAL